MKIFILMIMSLFSVTSFAISQGGLDRIKANSFYIVPINGFARSVPQENAREFYQKNCQRKDLGIATQLNCEVFKSCVGETCKRSYEAHGTAFLLGSGDQLVTAWHVLFATHAPALIFAQHHYKKLSLIERRQKLSGILAPDFILLNENKEVVYDTREDTENLKTRYKTIGDPLGPIFHASGKGPSGAFGYVENMPTDFVAVQLRHSSLGEGLEPGGEFSESQSPFWTTGYGYDRESVRYRVGTGSVAQLLDLKKQLGIFTDFQLQPLSLPLNDLVEMKSVDQLQVMGYSREQAESQIAEYGEELVAKSIATVIHSQQRNALDFTLELNSRLQFFEVASLPGQSGAPFVDDTGKVVGIVTNGFTKSESEDSPKIIGFGTGATSIQFLMEAL